MDEHLYITRASRFVEADPVRGRTDSDIEYSAYYLTIATKENVASKKLLAYLKKNDSVENWQNSTIRELYAGADVPLEKRVEILREVFPLIQ